MAIHYLHIAKSGGTALKYTIRKVVRESLPAGAEFDEKVPCDSPLGTVYLHGHGFNLGKVSDEELAFFSIRDPATRFISSFYSRLRKGMPRYFSEWSEEEAQVFRWFQTPQDLALALAKPGGRKRVQAVFAMNEIKHIRRPMTSWLGDADYLRSRLPQIAYIARQETLDEDWHRIKRMLDLPEAELPSDDAQAHRTTGDVDRDLSPKMMDALREWYAEDYEIVRLCDEVRPELIARAESRVKDRAEGRG